VDPIEKKPLNHFLPGTAVLSFGTAGCNLACRFCQNWDISKSREIDTLADTASPEQIAEAAVQLGCRSVAFTYNDPVIFMEYAMDGSSITLGPTSRYTSLRSIRTGSSRIGRRRRRRLSPPRATSPWVTASATPTPATSTMLRVSRRAAIGAAPC